MIALNWITIYLRITLLAQVCAQTCTKTQLCFVVNNKLLGAVVVQKTQQAQTLPLPKKWAANSSQINMHRCKLINSLSSEYLWLTIFNILRLLLCSNITYYSGCLWIGIQQLIKHLLVSVACNLINRLEIAPLRHFTAMNMKLIT